MYLAIDIGGTKTDLAFFSSGDIKSLSSSSSFKTIHHFNKEVKTLVEEVKKNASSIDKISLSFPGTITGKGEILKAGNLPDFVQKPLKREIEKELKAETTIIQDSACSAVAEVAYGYTKGYSKRLHLILGTGFGGALVKDDKKSLRVYSFEPGGMIVNVEKGRTHLIKKTRGFIEAYLGGGSIQKHYKKKLSETNDNDLIWKEVTKYLAVAINNLNCVLKPDLVVIGGGMGRKRKFALKNVEKEVEKISEFVKPPKIEFTKVDGNSSLLGAQAFNSSSSRITVVN